MKGDFTRFTFDPNKHLSAVLKQQGRVDLDADWNELIDILAHRLNEQTIDTIGGTGIPRPPGINPALGFQVSGDKATGAVQLTPGRIYIDGLLCENDAAPSTNGYYVPPLPTTKTTLDGLPNGSSFTALVYLEAWKRHVSLLEDPGLLEKALYGPDTATRVQTAWQAHVVVAPTKPGDCTPADDLPAASEALLSWRSVQTTDQTPCAMGGQGGYTGLENRLYRVEVHDPTTPNFKWSRDNSSIGLPIKDVDSLDHTRLEVAQLGASDYDRYYHHWVELLSDEAEYANGHGLLARVDDLDVINGFMVLDRPADDFAVPTNTHLRIRRWDMPYSDASAPLCNVGSVAWIGLEDNIEVRFDRGPVVGAPPPPPNFLSGDYWTFTARTIDSLVEEKHRQSPQGIEHHYCKLGFITWAKDGTGTITTSATQCVPTFPGLTNLPGANQCNCCIEIDATKDIAQQLNDAAAKLATTGGQILLPPGIHKLMGTVTVAGTNISIEGCAGQTKLIFTPANVQDPAFVIDGQPAARTRLFGFDLYATGTGPLVQVLNARDTTIERCRMVNLLFNQGWSEVVEASQTSIGLVIRDSDLVGDVGVIELAGDVDVRLTNLRMENCRMLARLVGVWLEDAFGITIRDSSVGGLLAAQWTELVQRSSDNTLLAGTATFDAELDQFLEHQPSADDLVIAELPAATRAADELEAVRDAGVAVGGLLPIGLALINCTRIEVSSSQVRAAAPIWGTVLADVLVDNCVLAGLFGLVVQDSSELTLQNSKFATYLDAVVGGGLISTWRVLHNAIFGRVGILLSAESESRFRLLTTFSMIAAGLQPPVPEWAAWTHSRTFDAGPANTAGGATLERRLASRLNVPGPPAIDIRHVEMRGNLVGAADIGIMVDDPGGVGTIAQTHALENQVVGCRAVGIRIQSASSAGDVAVRGNHLEVTGVGIRISVNGALVHANQVVTRGRASSVPIDNSALAQVARVIRYNPPREPRGLSYPPTVSTVLDLTKAALASGAPPVGLIAALQDFANVDLAALPYEYDILNFGLQAAAKNDFQTAAAALSAVKEPYMGLFDCLGVSVEAQYVVVVENLLVGQGPSRGGIAIQSAGVPLYAAFQGIAPSGPGANVRSGSFLTVGTSRTAVDTAGAAGSRSMSLVGGGTIGVDTGGIISGIANVFVRDETPRSEIDLVRNRLYNGLGHGIDIRSAAPRIRILENIIEGMAGSGVNMVWAAGSDELEISRNRIAACASASPTMFPSQGLHGIEAFNATIVKIEDNIVEQCGGERDYILYSILASVCRDVSIRGNQLVGNVNTGNFGDGCAVGAFQSFGSVAVESNLFRDNGSGGIFAWFGKQLTIATNQGSGLPTAFGTSLVQAYFFDSASIVNNQFDYPVEPSVYVMALANGTDSAFTNLLVGSNRVSGFVSLPSNSVFNEVVVGNINSTLLPWQEPQYGMKQFAANIPEGPK